MPRCFHVSLHPFFNLRDIFLGVLEVFAHVACLAARYEGIFRWVAGFGVGGPAPVLDTCRDVVRAAVGNGVLKIEVFGLGWAVESVEAVYFVSQSCACFEVLLMEHYGRRTGACQSPPLRMRPCDEPSRVT